MQSFEVREIKTEGKEPAVWTGKGHLVLNFPRQGYKRTVAGGGGASWHKQVTTHSCTSSGLSTFKQLFAPEIHTLLYKPRLAPNTFDSKRQ